MREFHGKSIKIDVFEEKLMLEGFPMLRIQIKSAKIDVFLNSYVCRWKGSLSGSRPSLRAMYAQCTRNPIHEIGRRFSKYFARLFRGPWGGGLEYVHNQSYYNLEIPIVGRRGEL